MFPFQELPVVVQDEFYKFCDLTTLLALRKTSSNLKEMVERTVENVGKLQVKIDQVEDFTWLKASTVNFSNFKADLAHWQPEEIRLNRFRDFLTLCSQNIKIFHSETWLSGEELDFLLSLPNLEVFSSTSYYRYPSTFITDKNVILENLSILKIQPTPFLKSVLKRAPRLKKLCLVLKYVDASSRDEICQTVSGALKEYITSRFYNKSGRKGQLMIDMGEPEYAFEGWLFRSQELLEICKMCQPVGVILKNVQSRSLPTEYEVKFNVKAQKSLECISNIIIVGSIKNKFFPSKPNTTYKCFLEINDEDLRDYMLPVNKIHDLIIDNTRESPYFTHGRELLDFVMSQAFSVRTELSRLTMRIKCDTEEYIVLHEKLDFELFPNLLFVSYLNPRKEKFLELCQSLSFLNELEISNATVEVLLCEDSEKIPAILKLKSLKNLSVSCQGITDRLLETLSGMELTKLKLINGSSTRSEFSISGLMGLVSGILGTTLEYLETHLPSHSTDQQCKNVLSRNCPRMISYAFY